MNRKIFLGLLPTLMALTACGGVTPKAYEPELFLEDTEAHEELFGSLAEPTTPIKSIRNEYEPVGSGEPLVGIQSKEYTTLGVKYIAIRFVAALDLDNPLTAVMAWERTMYAPDGSKSKSYDANLPCTKLYTQVYDGSSQIDVGSVPGDYNRFVMYTMRNIPLNNYGNHYLNVSLSLDGVLSKTVSTSVDQTKQMAFPYNQSGYFLYGNFNQYNHVIPQDVTTLDDGEPDTEGNNYASFTLANLRANDEFVMVNKAANTFKVFDYSCLKGESLVHFANDNDSVKTNFSGSYILYLNKSYELYTGSTLSRPDGYYLTGDFVGETWANLWNQYYLGSGDLPLSKTISFSHSSACKVVKVVDGNVTVWYGGDGGSNVSIGHEGVYSLNVAGNGVFSVSFVRPINFQIYKQWEPVSDSTYVMLSNSNETVPTIGKSVKLSSFNKPGDNYIVNSSSYAYAHISCVVDGEIKGYATVSLYDLKDHSYGFTTNFYESGGTYHCEILQW